MVRSSPGVALGMLLAVASAASGVAILVAPYVSAVVAVVLAAVTAVPLVVLWRSLAAEEAELLAVVSRSPDGRAERCRPEPPPARRRRSGTWRDDPSWR